MKVADRQPSSRATGRRVSRFSGTRARWPIRYRGQAGRGIMDQVCQSNHCKRRPTRQPVTLKLCFHDFSYFYSRRPRLDRRTRVGQTQEHPHGQSQEGLATAERHSSNRRNRNRIRRKLSRMIYHNKGREDISAEAKARETSRLCKLLEKYQRPQRKPTPVTWNGKGRGRQKSAPTRQARAIRWSGPIHSASVICQVTMLRKARGRRYGVVSNGRKFHGSYKYRRSRWWNRKIGQDKEEHLRTRDQERYFKECIKPILTIPSADVRYLEDYQPTNG